MVTHFVAPRAYSPGSEGESEGESAGGFTENGLDVIHRDDRALFKSEDAKHRL